MTVTSYGDHLRWFVIQGPSLARVRKQYMRLVGHPLVPPKRMLGLWVGKFGYKNWDQVFSDLKGKQSYNDSTFPKYCYNLINSVENYNDSC